MFIFLSGMDIGGRRVKVYRGMGSLEVISDISSAQRYNQHNISASKRVPEGVSGFVAYKGHISDVIAKFAQYFRLGMGYKGAHNIKEIIENARLYRVTTAGYNEGNPHDIIIAGG